MEKGELPAAPVLPRDERVGGNSGDGGGGGAQAGDGAVLAAQCPGRGSWQAPVHFRVTALDSFAGAGQWVGSAWWQQHCLIGRPYTGASMCLAQCPFLPRTHITKGRVGHYSLGDACAELLLGFKIS